MVMPSFRTATSASDTAANNEREFLKNNADLAGRLEGEIRRQTCTGGKYQPETPAVEAYVSPLDLADPLTPA
jgi:hypothetical protein